MTLQRYADTKHFKYN